MLSGDSGGSGGAAGREDGGRLYRVFILGQERHAGSGYALGAQVQACGGPLQRYLPGAAADNHPARLPAHLLQQLGQGRDEPENAAVPDGAFGHRRHDERIHASGAGGCGSGDDQDGGSRVGPERAAEAFRQRRK